MTRPKNPTTSCTQMPTPSWSRPENSWPIRANLPRHHRRQRRLMTSWNWRWKQWIHRWNVRRFPPKKTDNERQRPRTPSEGAPPHHTTPHHPRPSNTTSNLPTNPLNVSSNQYPYQSYPNPLTLSHSLIITLSHSLILSIASPSISLHLFPSSVTNEKTLPPTTFSATKNGLVSRRPTRPRPQQNCQWCSKRCGTGWTQRPKCRMKR